MCGNYLEIFLLNSNKVKIYIWVLCHAKVRCLRCTFQIFGGMSGSENRVTTVSSSLILGGWVTNVSFCDELRRKVWGWVEGWVTTLFDLQLSSVFKLILLPTLC